MEMKSSNYITYNDSKFQLLPNQSLSNDFQHNYNVPILIVIVIVIIIVIIIIIILVSILTLIVIFLVPICYASCP
jgi:uncharacterized membrane protein